MSLRRTPRSPLWRWDLGDRCGSRRPRHRTTRDRRDARPGNRYLVGGVKISSVDSRHAVSISIIRPVYSSLSRAGLDKASIHAQQRSPLRLAEIRVAKDRGFGLPQAGWAFVLRVPQDPRAGERRGERHTKSRRYGSQHAQGWFVQSTLQLAQVSVGNVRPLSELAQRQRGRHTLRAQQRTERRKLVLGRSVTHTDIFPLQPARGQSADSGSTQTRITVLGEHVTRMRRAWWSLTAGACPFALICAGPNQLIARRIICLAEDTDYGRSGVTGKIALGSQ